MTPLFVAAQMTPGLSVDNEKVVMDGTDGVGGEIAELEAAGRVPSSIANLAEVAAVGYGNGAAVLLRGVHVIRESVVRDYVVELPRRLVVPAAPRRSRVDADDGALVDAGE